MIGLSWATFFISQYRSPIFLNMLYYICRNQNLTSIQVLRTQRVPTFSFQTMFSVCSIDPCDVTHAQCVQHWSMWSYTCSHLMYIQTSRIPCVSSVRCHWVFSWVSASVLVFPLFISVDWFGLVTLTTGFCFSHLLSFPRSGDVCLAVAYLF